MTDYRPMYGPNGWAEGLSEEAVAVEIQVRGRARSEPVSAGLPSREDLAISPEEIEAAKLSAKCLVRNYLYADVAQLVAPGGTGKTTLLLYECIHIVLGMELWGLEVENPGWCLIVTKEDKRERLIARLRELAKGLALSDEQLMQVMKDVVILDVTGSNTKLCVVSQGNITPTSFADNIIETFRSDPPAMVTFDPLVSFGASETMVNDNEQALINVARRIVSALNCCVRLVHHTGKANAREGSTDQYSGRGGSALPDGTRMTAVLKQWNGKDELPETLSKSSDSSILELHRPKISYAPPNLPVIWLKRSGYDYENHFEYPKNPEQNADAKADQIVRFLSHRLKLNPPEHYTRNELDSMGGVLNMTRAEIRTSIAIAMARNMVTQEPLPQEKRRTRRTHYLAPNSADM